MKKLKRLKKIQELLDDFSSEMKSELRQNGFDIIDVKHTSSKYGAIECAKYLSLRKFKRDFEKENMLHRKKMNLNHETSLTDHIVSIS